MLDRKSIFKAVDLDIQNVPVPEWGGDICIRGLTARERDHFEASIGQSANLENLRARLVVLSICDEAGERVFKDSDATELGKKNARSQAKLLPHRTATGKDSSTWRHFSAGQDSSAEQKTMGIKQGGLITTLAITYQM